MLRRWCMVLALAVLTAGLALTANSASAAPTSGPTFSPGGLIHLMGVSAAHTQGLSFQAQSTNWSGYAGTTGTYTSVSASWTEPTGTCSRGDQYSSFWVGLDGYNSSSVEQTGSEVDCVGRTARYYAWYEMYPSASVTYSNTVAGPGCVIRVTAHSVTSGDARSFRHLVNVEITVDGRTHFQKSWNVQVPRMLN